MGRHRLEKPPKQQASWTIVVGVITIGCFVLAGLGFVLTMALTTGTTATQDLAAATTARSNPISSELTHPYLEALDKEHITLEPQLAVHQGLAVCEQRRVFGTSIASVQKQMRDWLPQLSPMQVARLVDAADRELCPLVK